MAGKIWLCRRILPLFCVYVVAEVLLSSFTRSSFLGRNHIDCRILWCPFQRYPASCGEGLGLVREGVLAKTPCILSTTSGQRVRT